MWCKKIEKKPIVYTNVKLLIEYKVDKNINIEPTKEVDFGTGVASESSSTSSKRSVTSSCTEESDWDSDMEDCESMENYETKNNDTIGNNVDLMKFRLCLIN